MKSYSKSEDNATHCRSYFITSVVLISSIIAGMNDGMIGPTLPDLAFTTGTATEEMSILFTWRASFAMVGSLLIGQLLDRGLEGSLVMAAAVLLLAIPGAITPWLSMLVAMCAVNAISSFFTAGVNTGNYSVSFMLWRSRPGPVMQAVRLCYTVGLALAPLLAAPFLQEHLLTDQTGRNASNWTNTTDGTTVSDTKVHFAYLILALMSLPVFIMYIFIYFKWNLNPMEYNECAVSPADNPYTGRNRWRNGSVLALFVLMTIVYGGMEVSLVGLLVTYVVDYLFWSKTQGVLISTVYQLSKLIIGFLTIFLAKYLKPYQLIIIDLVFMLGSTATLFSTILVGNTNAMWPCIVILAVGSASLYPSMISWFGELLGVTGKISALFNISFSIGVMTIPALTGYLLGLYKIIALPGVMLGCTVTSTVLFIFILILTTQMNQEKAS